MLSQDLIKELKAELRIRFSIDFKQLLLALFRPALVNDAVFLKGATRGLGTDERVRQTFDFYVTSADFDVKNRSIDEFCILVRIVLKLRQVLRFVLKSKFSDVRALNFFNGLIKYISMQTFRPHFVLRCTSRPLYKYHYRYLFPSTD